MLISIGRRPAAGDLVGLLLECHTRIRHFAALAVRLATSEAGLDERASVARSIARYFGEALPLHVRDEEESLLPRLRGLDLDLALLAMRREHREHDARRLELVSIAELIGEDPTRFLVLSPRLAALAAGLEKDFISHLALEEREILPRITALLSVEEQEAVVLEMRARRT